MDELPEHAKELLRLASDLDDCRDPSARGRVRERVAIAVGGVHAARGHAHRELPAATVSKPLLALTGKLALTTTLLALAGIGATLFRPSYDASEPISARSMSPLLVAPPAPPPERASEPPAESRPGAVAESTRAVGASPRARRTSRDTLELELELLRRVSEALTHGDGARARRLLDQHRTRFPAPTLREERAGFQALLLCLEQSADAHTVAQAFQKLYPQSVLGERVARACPPTGDQP